MLEWRQNIEQRDIKKERGSPIAPPPGQILWKGWNGDKILSRGTKIRVGRGNPKPPWSNSRGGVNVGMETKS